MTYLLDSDIVIDVISDFDPTIQLVAQHLTLVTRNRDDYNDIPGLLLL
jgi:predicted nucleic acid-binding protein